MYVSYCRFHDLIDNDKAMTVRFAVDKERAPVFVGPDGYPRRIRRSTILTANPAEESVSELLTDNKCTV